MDAKTVIDALGGPKKVAALCNVRPAAVYQWYGVHTRKELKGVPRTIPEARLQYLMVLKPEVFAELETRPAKRPAKKGSANEKAGA